MNILVVEDEKDLADSIVSLLRIKGFDAEAAYDGKSGLSKAEEKDFDLIIMDVMLPYMNGFEVTKTLREEKIEIPIMILTARGEMEDRVYGLEHGADYYLPKPFHTQELMACVKSLLRRQGAIDKRLNYGNTTLELSTAKLETEQGSVRLSTKEFDMMRVFMVTQHRNTSKDSIINKVWGYDSDATENLVEVYVSLLRKKLKAIGSDVSIAAIPRQGYHLEVSEND